MSLPKKIQELITLWKTERKTEEEKLAEELKKELINSFKASKKQINIYEDYKYLIIRFGEYEKIGQKIYAVTGSLQTEESKEKSTDQFFSFYEKKFESYEVLEKTLVGFSELAEKEGAAPVISGNAWNEYRFRFKLVLDSNS